MAEGTTPAGGESPSTWRNPLTITLAVLLMLALAVLGVVGVAALSDEADTTGASDASAASDTADDAATEDAEAENAVTGDEDGSMTVAVYYLRDEVVGVAHRTVPQTRAVARAAMEELLQGPTAYEAATGRMSTNIPEGTRLLGISTDGGVVTVDLSAEFETGGGTFSVLSRLAQVVHTLTQFPTVDSVRFRLDGEPAELLSGEGIVLDEPQTRAMYEDFAPAVLLESPALNDTVSSPLRLTGTANTFEATFMVRVTGPSGDIVYDDDHTATSGSGTRGTFDTTIDFDVSGEGLGAVTVYEISMADGSEVNAVDIPLRMR